MTSAGLSLCIVTSIIVLFISLKILIIIKPIKKHVIVSSILTLVIIGSIWISAYYYFNYTNSGKMAVSSEESWNSADKVDKTIKVYTSSGEIKTYEGKYEVLYYANRTTLDGEGEKISITGGTVIIEQDVISDLD